MFFTRLIYLLLAVSLFAVASTQAAEPYEARVTVGQVFTRSGPGENYYPTGYLSQGTIVEVYREDAGGWLAIRPPEGEFSLIRAENLAYRDDRTLAEVQAHDAGSYVGSQISDQHHVVHVKLDKSEPVEVLGILELRDPESGKKEAWYRIAPPAGEFRWISKHFVEAVSPEPPAVDPAVADPAAITGTVKDLDFWREGRGQTPGTPVQAASFNQDDDTEAGEPGEPRIFPMDGPTTTLNLLELELKISQEILKPVDQWDLEPLVEQANRLVATGESPLERGKARLLLEKIEEFNQLYERKLAITESGAAMSSEMGGSGSPATPAGALSTALGPRPAVDPAASFESGDFDPRYDGKGWLMPVITRAAGSRKSGPYTPPFALTDANGNVLQFVSPSPGLNLRRYARQEVGIYGQISPLDQYTRPHLTAHRIVVLSRHEKP